MKNYSVLMVCTGNICRSPMAEGILGASLPESLKPLVTVHSAGTQGLHGNRAEPFAMQAAAACGADVSEHRARLLDAKMVRESDLVLVMEHHHLAVVNHFFFFKCKYVHLMGSFDSNRVYPEIEDPYGLELDAYETCAAEIKACMPGVIAHIEAEIGMRKK